MSLHFKLESILISKFLFILWFTSRLNIQSPFSKEYSNYCMIRVLLYEHERSNFSNFKRVISAGMCSFCSPNWCTPWYDMFLYEISEFLNFNWSTKYQTQHTHILAKKYFCNLSIFESTLLNHHPWSSPLLLARDNRKSVHQEFCYLFIFAH